MHCPRQNMPSMTLHTFAFSKKKKKQPGKWLCKWVCLKGTILDFSLWSFTFNYTVVKIMIFWWQDLFKHFFCGWMWNWFCPQTISSSTWLEKSGESVTKVELTTTTNTMKIYILYWARVIILGSVYTFGFMKTFFFNHYCFSSWHIFFVLPVQERCNLSPLT